MTPRTMANLLAVREMLVTGRAYAARETLDVVIRENGGHVPTPPTVGPVPVPTQQRPVWMRTGA